MTQSVSVDKTNIALKPLGEMAITVEFGQGIHPELHNQVKALMDYLDACPFPGMVEYVAAYASVTVFYNPAVVSGEAAAAILAEAVDKRQQGSERKARVVEIPVCYGGEYGPDLAFVAEHNKLTPAEVIEIHAGGEYLVYMLGFAPGFPYLGGMSAKIAAPRRQSPRAVIPAGSVGIAGMQTGMYPIATPGGWQLIGRTPLELFRPDCDPPTLLRSGDIIRFRPISPAEYERVREAGQ